MDQSFSDYYTSDLMKNILVEGIKLKNSDAKIKKGIIGVVILAVVLAILTAIISRSFIPIIVIGGLAIIVCIVLRKKLGAFRNYFYDSILPSVARAGNIDLTYKDNNETKYLFQSSPLSFLFPEWTEAACYGSIALDIADYGIEDVIVGHMTLIRKERDKENKVRTITLFNGLMYHIPVSLGLMFDISIIYERSTLGKLAENTGRTIYKAKKIFTFSNSELETHFDCKVVPHGASLESTIVRAINNKLKQGEKEEYNSNQAYDEAHLEAGNLITAAMEEFLLFIFNNYGPFDLLIRNSGIYLNVYGKFVPGEQSISELPGLSISNLIARVLGVGHKSLKGSAGHLDDFLNSNCFGDTLKFEALNNNYEICKLAQLLAKYVRDPDSKDNYTEIVKDDFDYFDRTLKMKEVSAKQLNKEYDSYYNSVVEKSKMAI